MFVLHTYSTLLLYLVWIVLWMNPNKLAERLIHTSWKMPKKKKNFFLQILELFINTIFFLKWQGLFCFVAGYKPYLCTTHKNRSKACSLLKIEIKSVFIWFKTKNSSSFQVWRQCWCTFSFPEHFTAAVSFSIHIRHVFRQKFRENIQQLQS